jgi:hypothetical protein
MRNKDVIQALNEILEDSPIQREKVQGLRDRLGSIETLSSWYETIEADERDFEE